MKTSLFLLGAIGAQACQRERAFVQHSHPHVKRQLSNVAFPPALNTNEQLLLDSFDNTSISTWSYYYSTPSVAFIRKLLIITAHGAHLAGRNKTMAQWTADKWAEYGFKSRLDEYCECASCENRSVSELQS
jgi:N-acetylated-alpha-linked acidic dipeptidase